MTFICIIVETKHLGHFTFLAFKARFFRRLPVILGQTPEYIIGYFEDFQIGKNGPHYTQMHQGLSCPGVHSSGRPVHSLSVLETREKLSKKLRGHVNALKRVKSLARVLQSALLAGRSTRHGLIQWRRRLWLESRHHHHHAHLYRPESTSPYKRFIGATISLTQSYVIRFYYVSPILLEYNFNSKRLMDITK